MAASCFLKTHLSSLGHLLNVGLEAFELGVIILLFDGVVVLALSGQLLDPQPVELCHR